MRKFYSDPETHFTKKMRLEFGGWKVKDFTQKVTKIPRP